jgi:hypothetical protein
VYLFSKLAVKYAQKFTSVFGDDEDVLHATQHEWAESLGGIPKQQLRQGLDACIDQYPSWPPTVGEFKQLCKLSAKSLGVPTVEAAWLEVSSTAMTVNFSHGIVLAVSNDPRCITFEWRLLPFAKGLKLFDLIYSDYLARVAAGEVFILLPAIENKVGKPVTKSERLAASNKWMDQLKGAIAR